MLDALREPYVRHMSALVGVDRDALDRQAERWLASMRAHIQEEVDAMAVGSGHPTQDLATFLYADIAKRAPLCTGVVAPGAADLWVARNCDWWRATLMRGTSCVIHEIEGRIPCLGVGINADIDIDTGANAEQLWIHVHSLTATDKPTPGAESISWLFWAREALETCASLADVEAMLDRVERDRGMILFVIDGKSGEAALYECHHRAWLRVDPRHGRLSATNHCQHKHPPAEKIVGRRPASTTARLARARALLAHAGEEIAPPGGLMRLLADPGVEMRTAEHLTTIYSSVCCPASGELWFASGQSEADSPAASRARWRRIAWPWGRVEAPPRA
jgi:hypothetical protein